MLGSVNEEDIVANIETPLSYFLPHPLSMSFLFFSSLFFLLIVSVIIVLSLQ